MRMWEISPRVNSPKNDDPSLWEPLHTEPDNTTIDALELLRPVGTRREVKRHFSRTEGKTTTFVERKFLSGACFSREDLINHSSTLNASDIAAYGV